MATFDFENLSYDELKDSIIYVGTPKIVTLASGLDAAGSGVEVSKNNTKNSLLLMSIGLPYPMSALSENTMVFGNQNVTILSGGNNTGFVNDFDLGPLFMLLPPGRALYTWPIPNDLALSAAVLLQVFEYQINTLPVTTVKEIG